AQPARRAQTGAAQAACPDQSLTHWRCIMAEISRVAVFGKLNGLAYKAVEGATVFCKLRGNPYVELEHWIAQILQSQDSDWHRIARHYALDGGVIAKDLTAGSCRVARAV